MMPVAKARETKAERIEVRVTSNAKALLTAAAEARHTTVSELLLRTGVEAAEDVLAIPRVFYASEEGWEQIQQMLADDVGKKPSAETIEWLRKAPRIR